MIFQLHLLYLSAGQWGKQRGDEQGYVQFTPWNTSTDWVELVSFLLHPTFSALEWTFHTSSVLRRAEQSCLSCQGMGEETGGNTGSKPSKQLRETGTEMQTPENQPNGIKRRLPNLFWEKRRCCPSQRDFFKVLTDALLLKCHYIYIVLNSAVSRLYSLTTISSSRGLIKTCNSTYRTFSPGDDVRLWLREISPLCMHVTPQFELQWKSTTLSSYLYHIPKEAPSHHGKVYLLI